MSEHALPGLAVGDDGDGLGHANVHLRRELQVEVALEHAGRAAQLGHLVDVEQALEAESLRAGRRRRKWP